MLQLPPEIISEIFMHFLPDPPDFPPLSGSSSPQLLCQICRQWSAIALSLPRLWSTIRIVFTRRTRIANGHSKLFKTWLSRSADCPLSISLRSFTDTYGLLSYFIRFSQFEAISARLEYLDLALPFNAMAFVPCDMPNLRRVALTLTSVPSWGREALTLFGHSPLLTHVSLERFYTQFTLRLPWAQFTHLEVQYLQLAECAEVLGKATGLVHCVFGIYPSDESMDSDVPAFPAVPTHHQLRHLILRPSPNQAPDSELWTLLDRLTLPALRTLEVFELAFGVDSLKALVVRSQCSLDELRIMRGAGGLSEAVYRKALPSVRNIVLEVLET
ncbi:hypothetical protein C8R46DRAFT_275728 [Mycena filopes]|nr:hypothetical protein C8R46DRAFT_275728 [Mycena filopes]